MIDQLRNEKLKVQEARKAGLDVRDSEVDEAYTQMARRYGMTPERSTAFFAGMGINVDTIKHMLRADLASRKMQGSFP